MAKSLRSKTKRRFRTLKRDSVFAPVEEARLARLAERQASNSQGFQDGVQERYDHEKQLENHHEDVNETRGRENFDNSATSSTILTVTSGEEKMQIDLTGAAKEKMFSSRRQFRRNQAIKKKQNHLKRLKQNRRHRAI